jgi:phosphopentomutase
LDKNHREIALVKAFGTAGVRGVFNKTQTPEQVYTLVETIAFAYGKGRYGIGWDGRKVSSLLARTVMSAVSAVGSEACVFGLVPTPVLAYGTRTRSCMAGFSVTASHNPPEFSGVKVFNHDGMELPKTDEERIERALSVDVMKSSGVFGEQSPDNEILQDYMDSLIPRYDRASEKLRIAVDCASGPGGLVTPELLKALGHDVIPVNAQVSWMFPARFPEPTPATLVDFSQMVKSLGADFGFAHDGDADRLVMVDGAGNVVPDSIVTILALRALGSSSGVVVISENTSTAVAEEAERLGFKVLRSRVGKTFAVLASEGGVFAAEPSKVVDPSWGLWEDGINASAMISTLLARERGLLAKLVNDVPWKFKQTNLRAAVRMPVLIENARAQFRKYGISEERVLDGYKVVLEDGSWVMFRPSGTEPIARLYCESRDPQFLESLVQQGSQCVHSSAS